MRKPAFIVAITIVLSLACSVFAQPPGGGREGRGGPEGREGRGGPDGRERRGGGPGDFRSMIRSFPVMAALDADEDGEISAEEIKNASAALAKLDKNSDGKLSEEEMRPEIGRGRGFGRRGGGGEDMVARFMEHDKNKDGKLAKDEVPEELSRMFGRADADGDDVVTKEELETMVASFRERAGGRGGFGRRGGGEGEGGRGGRGGRGGGGGGGDRPQRPQRPE